ncbi:MAG: serine protease [Acidobacteriaceae bacterium]|nr:serine protease [Acidobacteriaceae bacterium]
MSSTQSNNLGSFSQTLTELVSETANGVVAIKSAAYRVTSGVALGDNLIAAASHSLRREERVPVIGANGEATGAILGRDPGIDLAILKAEGLNTRALPKADATTLKAGMLAVAVGFTADVGATASLGILGAVGPERRNWRGGTLDHFLRLDANVYPSQSGAAVINAEGQLIGMATPALSRHSTMVVPVATIERIARELAEQGRIRHGYLGIGVQPVEIPENLRSKMQSAATGLIVLSVETGSPAEKAGLQLGDILLTLNRKAMTDIGELHSALRGEIVDKQVEAIVLRGGAPVIAEVTVAERGKKS